MSVLCAPNKHQASPSAGNEIPLTGNIHLCRYVWAAIMVFLFVSGCATMGSNYVGLPSNAWPKPEQTGLGREFAPDMARNPGKSGFYLLSSGRDAFFERIALIDAAEQTLDLQYYIIRNDLTSKLLIERLIQAADRGVRVRILVDDFGSGLREFKLELVDVHPNIEVRFFNPFTERRPLVIPQFLEYLGNLKKLNRRMHNKIFIADNQAAIIGGRNIADEYFEAREDIYFADLDLLAIGPVVKDASASFDEYWNSKWAVPIEAFHTAMPKPEDLERTREKMQHSIAKANRTVNPSQHPASELKRSLENGEASLVWAEGKVIYDPPDKGIGAEDKDPSLYMGGLLGSIQENTQRELLLISPYFVPGREGIEIFRKLRERGVSVKILTNSLATTDAPSIHSGYSRYRSSLIEMGVELYEIRPTPGGSRRKLERMFLGSSFGASLHAKAYISDRQTIFVGSRNIDPRSARINTEIGLLVESPELASELAALFELATLPKNSFRLSLEKNPPPMKSGSSNTAVIWTTEENGKEVQLESEPFAGYWRPFEAGVMSLFTPESFL